MTNLVFNGDLSLLPPTRVIQTTGLRWMTGTATGSSSDKTYGWYFSDNTLKGSTAGFNPSAEHTGGGSLTLNNTTVTGKSTATSIKITAKPNTIYTLSLYCKTTGVPTNGVYAKANFYTATGTVANSSATTNKVSGDNDCVLLSKTFTTIGSTAFLAVELDNMVPGALCSATFHDIVLEEKTNLTAVPMNTTTGYGVNAPFNISGTAWTRTQLQNYCDKVIGLGGQWIRASFIYSYIHTVGASTYNYALYDNFIQIVNAKGLQVLPIVSFPPTSLGTQEFSDYFTNIAQHFSTMGIRYYELWNEKNLKGAYNLSNDPTEYAALIKAAYPALKTGDPKCKVLFSGLMGGTIGDTTGDVYSAPDFLQAVYMAGGGNSFDIMNYHPYGHVEAVIQAIRTVMYNNGDECKQLWFTEDGIPTNGKSGQLFTTEDGQATYLIEGINLAKKYSVNKLFFYNGNDSIASQPDREGYFGLTKGSLDNLTNKVAYQVVANNISNS